MGGKKKGGDAAKGEKIFKSQCAICHAIGKHGTGPNLQGVNGRPIAEMEGFGYS